MTDYNDGNWHGWNGGECPVHPKSEVEAVWHDQRTEKAGMTGPRPASDEPGPTLAWAHVVRFRVVKAYREPRDLWLCEWTNGRASETFMSERDATNYTNGRPGATVTRFAEVPK